eukprot:763020-Hanusia_phi.AAC.5
MTFLYRKYPELQTSPIQVDNCPTSPTLGHPPARRQVASPSVTAMQELKSTLCLPSCWFEGDDDNLLLHGVPGPGAGPCRPGSTRSPRRAPSRTCDWQRHGVGSWQSGPVRMIPGRAQWQFKSFSHLEKSTVRYGPRIIVIRARRAQARRRRPGGNDSEIF